MEVAAEADAMVTVFGILNLTEDSFFDESRRLDPPALSPRRSKCCESDRRRGCRTGRQPSGREACIAADEIRRIAPLARRPVRDQMHRVSIDSFQPETQRYALKRAWAT